MAIDDPAVVTSIISGGNGELLCAAPYVCLFWNVCPEDESDDKDGFCRCSMIDAATDVLISLLLIYYYTYYIYVSSLPHDHHPYGRV